MNLKGVKERDPDFPVSIAPNDIKAHMDITMKYRLYDGVHVQRPDGTYEYYEFPCSGTFEVGVIRLEDIFREKHVVSKVEVKE